MANLPAHPDSNVGPGRASITSIPRWVKVFGVIVLVLVLLFVILHLTGLHGGHTPPEGHTPSGDHAPHEGHAPPDGHGGHDLSKWGHK